MLQVPSLNTSMTTVLVGNTSVPGQRPISFTNKVRSLSIEYTTKFLWPLFVIFTGVCGASAAGDDDNGVAFAG